MSALPTTKEDTSRKRVTVRLKKQQMRMAEYAIALKTVEVDSPYKQTFEEFGIKYQPSFKFVLLFLSFFNIW